MPIIIKKGSDADKKKKSKYVRERPRSRSSTPPERINVDNIATDMTDVLNFKAYRIIKPNFYNQTTRINLIGEDYYKQDDPCLVVNVGIDGNPLPEEVTTVTNKIDEIIALQRKNERVGRQQKLDMYSRIKDFEKKSVALKSGHSIDPMLAPPTLSETLAWAIKYVSIQEDNLVAFVVNMYYNMKCYDNTVERLQKQAKEGRSRAASEDFSAGRERTMSEDTTHSGRERTMSEDWQRGRERTASAVSDSGSWGDGVFHSPFHSPTKTHSPTHNATAGGNKQRRNSSRQLSTGNIGEQTLLGTQQQSGRKKNTTLAQQLDHIKSQGTDSFIRSIMPPKEQIFPAGKRTWRGQSSSQHRASNSDLGESASSHSLDYGNSRPRRPSVSKPGSGQGGGRTAKLTSTTQAPGALGALDETEEKSSTRPAAVPPSPRHSGTQSLRAAVGNTKAIVTTGSVHSFEEPKTSMMPRPAPPVGAATSFTASPRTSHVKAEATMRPVERTSSISPGHAKKATLGQAVQQTVDVSQVALQALLQKTSAIQCIIASKIRKAERSGARLIQKQNDFSSAANKAHDKALSMVDQREFQRPLTLMHQVTTFEDEAPASPRSHGKGLKNDLLLMRSAAEKKTFDVQMHRLVQHRWFVALMLKLRDYMKKMNNQVPLGCLKFVVVLEQVLLMGHKVNQAVFYADLEATVKAEEHVKVITHQLLRIVRRALDISDVVFLQYLEDKEIAPHPELVNQVKMMSRKPTQTAAGLNALRAFSFFLGGTSHGPSERATNIKVAFNVEGTKAMLPQLAEDEVAGAENTVLPVAKVASPSTRLAAISPSQVPSTIAAADAVVVLDVTLAAPAAVPAPPTFVDHSVTATTISAITADSALMTDSL